MATKFASPLETLLPLQRALESAMKNNWFGMNTTSRGAYPPVNVFRENDDYVIVTEIPGIRREDLDVQVKHDQVRLSGRKEIRYGENASIHRRERDHGGFDRTITVPFQIDADNVKAEYRNGILALRIPRAEADKPRSISIA